MKEKYIDFNEITLGVCYYPEHWKKNLWANDLERMVECGIKVVRIAEFSWGLIEPQEGVFDFNLFDEFMQLAKKYPIKIIFCTPSATPPAWLTEKYKEVLNADIYGNKLQHGLRRHYNYNSPIYRKLVGRIVTQLGEHYGKDTQIIGWQIDNEFNCEIAYFYSDADNIAFRKYVQNKYKTLDELNEIWGTVFWSQTYTDWEQIHVPRPTSKMQTNPHVLLDYKEFISDSVCEFAKMQADILKQNINENQFITTNGIFENLNYHKLQDESLDFITYDSYPNFGYAPDRPKTELKDRKWSLNLSTVRSISPIFGIMEQQVGAGGWVSSMKGPSPRPGQMRLWSYQSLAHGADFISYFRWRTCTFGTEIYWHGLNDYSNVNNRKIEELKWFASDLKKMKSLQGARFNAKLAILRTYANTWDTNADAWCAPLVSQSEIAWFTSAQYSHTPIDIVYLDSVEDLSKYSLVVYPHPVVLSQSDVAKLENYVKNGGTVIVGARAGLKDIHGQCTMAELPGLLENLCGVTVEEFTMVCLDNEKSMANFKGTPIEMPLFNDILKVTGDNAKVLANYTEGYYNGKPAIVENRVDKGRVIYYGSAFEKEAVDKILEYCKVISPYDNKFNIPKCCELSVRTKNGKNWYFVLNYSAEKVEINVNVPILELTTEKQVYGKIEVEPYGVVVFYE